MRRGAAEGDHDLQQLELDLFRCAALCALGTLCMLGTTQGPGLSSFASRLLLPCCPAS